MAKDSIVPGHCYYGRCSDGMFVIRVKNVSETHVSGQSTTWSATGELVFMNGLTITACFPDQVVDYMVMMEISEDAFNCIYHHFVLSRNVLRDLFGKAIGKDLFNTNG